MFKNDNKGKKHNKQTNKREKVTKVFQNDYTRTDMVVGRGEEKRKGGKKKKKKKKPMKKRKEVSLLSLTPLFATDPVTLCSRTPTRSEVLCRPRSCL